MSRFEHGFRLSDYLIARFETRISTIEDRLKAIESKLSGHTTSGTAATSAAAPAAPTGLPPAAASVTAAIQPHVPPGGSASASAKPVDFDGKPGNWLGLIGALCFVLAAGFIIKLSIETGWLTPARQIGIAVLFGLSLIAVGFRLMKSDRGYASLLPAAGIVVLYLSAFAGHLLYQLVTLELALASVALVSGLCIWLYTEIKHDIYAVTAAVGTYLAPAILGFPTSDDFTIHYYLLASFAFATISIWVQSRTLTVVASYLAIIMTTGTGLASPPRNETIAYTLLMHFLIFVSGTYLYSRHAKKGLTTNEAWSFFPVLLIFYAAEFYFVSKFASDQAPWISLGAAGLILGMYLLARIRLADNAVGSRPMIVGFLTVVLFHSAYLELLPMQARPWLFVLAVLALAAIPLKAIPKTSGDYRFPIAMAAVVLAIEFVSMCFHLITVRELDWLPVSLLSLTGLWALIVMKSEYFESSGNSQIVLGSAHLLALLGLYRLVFDHGSLAVSAAWLSYAVSVIGFGFFRKDSLMAKSAVFVLGFAAAKALLYDAASAPTVVRIFCLLLTGAALYGSGFLMRKIESWKRA